jgi:hypothetical protein
MLSTVPERVRLITLPVVESHVIPFQPLQQSEEGVHEFNNFDGSEVIWFLNCSNASLSTILQALEYEMSDVMKRKNIGSIVCVAILCMLLKLELVVLRREFWDLYL